MPCTKKLLHSEDNSVDPMYNFPVCVSPTAKGMGRDAMRLQGTGKGGTGEEGEGVGEWMCRLPSESSTNTSDGLCRTMRNIGKSPTLCRVTCDMLL